MKKNVLLLLFVVFIFSCKTYEDTVKNQDFGTLMTYYEKTKKQSYKKLKSVAHQMREKNLTFSDTEDVYRLINNKGSEEDFDKLIEKSFGVNNKDNRKNSILNDFQANLTKELFKVIDNSKSFEDIKAFLNSKQKDVLNSNLLTLTDRKKLLRAILSLDIGMDFIAHNVDLLDIKEEDINKSSRMLYNKPNGFRRCRRLKGKAFKYRCPPMHRYINRIDRTYVCCRNLKHSQATPYLPVIWGTALAEPTPIGEVIAVGATIVIGAGILFKHIKNNSSYRKECINIYVNRCNRTLYPCSTCLQFCITNRGIWDQLNCPLN